MLNKTDENKEVLSRLNFLRGIFAIMIVIGHCSMNFEEELLPLFIIHKFNMVGVCFFFYISGLSLTYNFYNKQNYLKHFVRNKVIILFVFAIISQIISNILNALILQKPLKIDITLVSEFNWYVYEMIIFYLVFYLLYRFIDKPLYREIILIIVTLMICITTLYFVKYGKWSGWTKSYYTSSFSFPYGVLLSEQFEMIHKKTERHTISYGILFTIVAAICCVSLFLPDDSFFGGVILKNLMGICIMTVITIIIVYLDVKNIPYISPIINFLTKRSTEIYLYQFCWLRIITALYQQNNIKIGIGYVFITTFLTILVAMLMHNVNIFIAVRIKGQHAVGN